jgi:hypothetical protein
MRTILFILIAILLSANNVSSQEEIILANRDGVKISYQLILEDAGKKKDKYILIVQAENISDVDLYYSVRLTNNEDGTWSLPIIPEEIGFTKIKVRNSTGLFGNGQSIFGDETPFVTTNDYILYELKIGNMYVEETIFKLKSGEKPLITNSFTKSLKEIEEFDIKIFSKMLNGNYISSCGNIVVNISAESSPERGDYLLQTTNGKQFVWIRKSETTFIRENGSGYSLTFNKTDKTFTYSTADGISCIWKKE